MARVYNFSAGPATLPEDVLKQAAAEMLDYRGCGMSVMEMSHRSKEFKDIIETAEADLRELLGMPNDYRVIFMQGGATAQFAAVPMNLMRNRVANYVVSGNWSNKAAKEASLFGDARIVATSKDDNFSSIPNVESLVFDADADYVYICQNETITGTAYRQLPDTQGKPLVADVSSMMLSEPMDVSRYGVVFGGVQKNVGPAGVAIVIARGDLVTDEVLEGTPTILNWKVNADKGSLNNTPPCYAIYVCGLVFKWLKSQGGLSAVGERNRRKAALLYDFLDQSELFTPTARVEDRSMMNIPFVTGDADLDAKFCAEAAECGIANIKGHRSVGGMRASLYNAMPIEGVKALVDFMERFEKENA